MKFFIKTEFQEGYGQHSCERGRGNPRAQFRRAVEHAKRAGYISVELIRSTAFGTENRVCIWDRRDNDCTGVRGPMTAAFKYKVHSARAPLGTASPSSSNTYYDTLEEAQAQAEKCVQKWGENHEGCIIYEAIKFVRRETPPIVVEDIE